MGNALAVEGGGQRDVHNAQALLHRRQRGAGVLVWRRAVVGAGVRGEGGVDGGDHVVLRLGHSVRVVLGGILVAGLHGRHVRLHGQQGAVHGRFLIVNINAAEVASAHVGVDDMAVRQNMGEGALVAELAVALSIESADAQQTVDSRWGGDMPW